MANSTVKVDRPVNVQPNHLPATIEVMIGWGDGQTGSVKIPQTGTRSDKNNISFAGGVRKGLRFLGEPRTVLESLALFANDQAMTKAAAGVHLSSPRLDRATGNPRPNTGGNLTVCHTTIIDLPSLNGETIAYQVQVYVTYLGEEKGYNLSVKGIVRPVNVGGPVVVGELTGLTID